MRQPTITSAQNPQVGLARRILARPQEARREGLLAAEGIHLVEEAIRAGLSCRSLLVVPDEKDLKMAALIELAVERQLPIHYVAEPLIRKVSSLETPQGVVGIFARPGGGAAAAWDRVGPACGHLAVADGLQDPANLGSLARSALGAGLCALVTTPGTVDPFHHRALRAAQGASFRLPVFLDQPPRPLADRLRGLGYLTVGLCADGDRELVDLDPAQPTAIFLGSEGAGLSSDAREVVSHRVRIPIAPGVESLGVAAAGAIAFYWLRLTEQRSRRGG